MKPKLEICCFTIDSCITAEQAGADRIELCSGPAEGGLTPSAGIARAVQENCRIPFYPIIRPRGGDFLYTDAEFRVMIADIQYFRSIGCRGIVTGFLHPDGSIDVRRMTEAKAAAGDMDLTFHRAFDMCADPLRALEELISCGVNRVLTSGQQPTALEGVELLKTLVAKAAGRISVMPGAGVRAENIRALRLTTGASEFHSSASMLIKSQMEFFNTTLSMGSTAADAEYQWPVSNEKAIREMRMALDE